MTAYEQTVTLAIVLFCLHSQNGTELHLSFSLFLSLPASLSRCLLQPKRKRKVNKGNEWANGWTIIRTERRERKKLKHISTFLSLKTIHFLLEDIAKAIFSLSSTRSHFLVQLYRIFCYTNTHLQQSKANKRDRQAECVLHSIAHNNDIQAKCLMCFTIVLQSVYMNGCANEMHYYWMNANAKSHDNFIGNYSYCSCMLQFFQNKLFFFAFS